MARGDEAWVLGFTGSQRGASKEQMESVWSLLHGALPQRGGHCDHE